MNAMRVSEGELRALQQLADAASARGSQAAADALSLAIATGTSS